jgi:membrane protein implicated in regulation of membrane protease activity
MATRIIINDREVTNPYIKGLLILGSILVAALVATLVIFVLLPIIGIAVTVSVGFIVVLIIATLLSAATLALVTVLAAWLFGAAEFRFDRSRRQKHGPDVHND